MKTIGRKFQLPQFFRIILDVGFNIADYLSGFRPNGPNSFLLIWVLEKYNMICQKCGDIFSMCTCVYTHMTTSILYN